MFIVAQLPLADFRPLIKGGRGRLTTPDWGSHNLYSGFIRGFGKISSRNGSGLGLVGERSFADANKALRLYNLQFSQPGWNKPLRIWPWFRRLYYDGQIAGRFEIGFMMPQEEVLLRFENAPLDPQALAQAILSTSVQINSLDGTKQRTIFSHCAEYLGLAYITSTTRNDALSQFPIMETYGTSVFVGPPMLHIRIPPEIEIQASRDRRYLNSEDDPEFFITSARGSEIRNNVLVQGSTRGVRDEAANERVARVLFAHLNSLLFSHGKFVETGQSISGERSALRSAVEAMIQRFARLESGEGNAAEKEFADGMKLFAKSYAGRVDELVAKLQRLSKTLNSPTTLEKFKEYFKGVHDLMITSATKAATEQIMKPK